MVTIFHIARNFDLNAAENMLKEVRKSKYLLKFCGVHYLITIILFTRIYDGEKIRISGIFLGKTLKTCSAIFLQQLTRLTKREDQVRDRFKKIILHSTNI